MGLLSAVRSRGFLLGCGTLLLIGAVLAVGLWLEWGWVVTLLVVAVLLLFLGLIGVLTQNRARSASKAIEQQLAAQAQQQMMSMRPDQQPEIQQLQEQLERAIETLKQSKLGKGRWRPGGGTAALYALPWYLFIGPPGAGKTTAIAHSGLHFPVGADRIRGVGGTRNCDWFFTDQAILLDTAGRYVTEPEDTDEWYAFLDTLKKHRKERPINGVLVGIALDELAGASPAEVDDHADTIRRRLDELIRRLGLRFPVYLLFTKADLLHGFVEFFGELGRREREAIWGATLTAEQQRAPDLRAVFEREFDLLEDALVNARTARLGRSMKREERGAVYHFPLQFAALKSNLSRFVERLYQPNPYQETPLVRGFYFTSGTQEGIPIDRVIQNLAARFDLPPELAGGFQATPEPKSYFIKDLFNEVVVPDQYLVRRTSKAASQQRLAKAGASLAAVLGLLLFGLLVSQATVRSRADIDRIRDAAALAATVQWDEARPSPDDLRRLDSLHSVIERYDGGPPLLQIGLNRRGTVLEPARGLYLRKARGFVETYALQGLRARLLGAVPAADLLAQQRTYEDLKAWLLLTDLSDRLSAEDTTDAAFLRRHLGAAARTTIYGADSIAVPAAARARIEAPVAAFVDGLRAERVAGFTPESGLVARVRGLIYERPSVAGVYARIKSEGNARVSPFRFPDAVPGRYLGLFEDGPEVPGFFTRPGWETFAAAAFAEEAADPSRDDWVMGRTAAELPPEFQDREQMLAQLQATYFAEYAQAWQQFMRSVRYRSLAEPRRAAEALEALANTTDSPLLLLLARVTTQTTLDATEGSGLVGTVRDAAGRQVDRILGNDDEAAALNPVARQFNGLHVLAADQAAAGGAAPELYQALEALGQVGAALGEIADDPARAADYLSQGSDLREDALRSIRTSLNRLNPEVRRALFEQPLEEAWDSVRRLAGEYRSRSLNAAWREEVYEPFQRTLAGRYPFDSTSAQDAPLGDFEDFFRPQDGALAQFAATLEPYLEDATNPLRLSSAAERALARGREISRGVFSGGALRLDFDLQPELPIREGGAPAASFMDLAVHGQRSAYNMGLAEWSTFSWPGSPGASLTLTTQQGTLPPRGFDGDWAWFRLLAQAEVTPRSSTEYEVRWPFRSSAGWTLTARYRLRSRSASAPFAQPARFFSFSPPSALN